ncbi:hypothetical protein LOD99_6377 [Oopsacas minuta]|uniref:Uncharacterized protein n=1 Tax=Oopsacas minuta TaxID=111878 RepID=A0AAV7JM05_9METZ|nr:hypothetical protein LOD99_6377 [Oopsacas minuta]
MSKGVFSKAHEGRGWRCPEKGCKKFVSLRVGSFFERSNIPLTQLVEFLYFGAEGLQSTHFLTLNLKWSPNTITDWKILLGISVWGSTSLIPNQSGDMGTSLRSMKANLGKKVPSRKATIRKMGVWWD